MGRKRCPQGRLRTAASGGAWNAPTALGVYFIFQALEQRWTFRPGRQLVSRTSGDRPTTLSFTGTGHATAILPYFYLRDEVLGPMIVRMGTFIPFKPATAI